MNDQTPQRQRRAGILTGVACYVLWGVLPLYWGLLDSVSSIEIICQRIIWCCVLTVGLCLIMRYDLVGLLRQKRARRFSFPHPFS